MVFNDGGTEHRRSTELGLAAFYSRLDEMFIEVAPIYNSFGVLRFFHPEADVIDILVKVLSVFRDGKIERRKPGSKERQSYQQNYDDESLALCYRLKRHIKSPPCRPDRGQRYTALEGLS